MRSAFFCLLLCGLSGTVAAQPSPGSLASAPEIVSTGTGDVKLPPDRATATVAVVTRAPSAAEAGQENVERMVPMLAALRRQGLPDSAIVTSGYSVALDRDPYGRQPVAPDVPPVYVARNAVRVTLNDLDALGRLLDTALAVGASEIANITFASSRTLEARQRAIALAVQRARSDAEAAAAASGGTLGALRELIVDPELSSIALRSMDFAGVGGLASVPTPLMPGEITVQVRVRLRYEFVARP